MAIFRRLWLLAANDLRLVTKDRAAFFWMLVLPIGMMWLFGQMGGSANPKLRLAVDSADPLFLARSFEEELGRLGGEKLELVPAVTPALPKRPSRTLRIPADFTTGLLEGRPQKLSLAVREKASDELNLGAEAYLFRAGLTTVGRLFWLDAEGRPEDPAATAAAFAEIASRKNLVTLQVSQVGEGRAVPSGFAQSVPGILTMCVLMMTLIYGGLYLVLEKEAGLLRRQLALPLRRTEVIWGKLLGRLAIALVQIVLLVLVGRWVFGLDFGSSWLGLALVAGSFAFAVAGLSMLLGAWLRTREQVSTLGWLLSMFLAALGGCWFPREVMPDFLQGFGYLLPTAWAMEGFHQLISYGRGLEAVWLPSTVLLAFGIVFASLGARRLSA